MSKVAIITGGGRGIGRATAQALVTRGWSVVIAGRRQQTLDEAVTSFGGSCIGILTDVSKPDEVDALFARAVQEFGRVDLLFNNAGITSPAVPIDELPVAVWNEVVATNLTGTFLCARAAFGQMRAQRPRGGRIINNGSISARTPRPFSAPYAASKSAVAGLTKCLALDGRALGISCGQINLGNISSDMGDQMAAGQLQADGSTKPEAVIAVVHAVKAIVYMAELPPEATVLDMTVMASEMPFVGRG